MTLEGECHGLAAILNTVMMAVELLLAIFKIPVGSDEVSQLRQLTPKVTACFSHDYTTTSTEQQRWLSFIETTTCLAPLYYQAIASKTFKTLLMPVIFLLEGTVQLWGVLDVIADTATGQGTPTTTIHATPMGCV